MSDPIALDSEAHLAKERIDRLEESLIAKRTRNISLAILLGIVSAGIALTGLWMLALISIVGGLIFLSQYFDANGHLHEVQGRSTKRLVSDFSVLRRPDAETSAKARPASHESE